MQEVLAGKLALGVTVKVVELVLVTVVVSVVVPQTRVILDVLTVLVFIARLKVSV